MYGGISKENLSRLLELNVTLMQDNLGLGQKIQRATDTLREMVSADRCSVFIHDRNRRSFWTVHVDGLSFMEIPEEKGIVGLTYTSRQPLIDNDVQNNPHFYKEIDEQTGYITKSLVAVPVEGYDNHCLGVIEFINNLERDGGFDEQDLKVIKFAVNHLITFIEYVIQERNIKRG